MYACAANGPTQTDSPTRSGDSAASEKGTPESVGVSSAMLASLERVVSASGGEADRAAAVAMLWLREQVFLPFRTPTPAIVDGSVLNAWADRSAVRRTFAELGSHGRHMLERGVREAADGTTGVVHLPGDDASVLGRACLTMMGSAYGDASLPFLIGFASAEATRAERILLQRAAVTVIRDHHPGMVVPDDRDWRSELGQWFWLLKSLGPGVVANSDRGAPLCD